MNKAGIDADISRCVDDIFRLRGHPAAYIPAGGGPVPIVAIIAHGEDTDGDRWNTSVQSTAEAYLRESDAADPKYPDVIEMEGMAWTISRRLGRSAGMWHLELVRDLRPTFRQRG